MLEGVRLPDGQRVPGRLDVQNALDRTPNRYNNVITTIVRLSYRKLECFIVKYLQPKLQLISREELKMIKTPLVNCRTWMTDLQAENFHRFVKLTYKLKTREPDRHLLL